MMHIILRFVAISIYTIIFYSQVKSKLLGVAECVIIRRYFAYRLVSNDFIKANS